MKPNKQKIYQEWNKNIGLYIQNNCFDYTKQYGWISGWRLNKIITGTINSTWKLPLWVLWLCASLMWGASKIFILMCLVSIARTRGD
tara:strand:+ start:339 stop:599 length:261 start_codon:yes stop_codon:yes gene_type:complete